MSDTQTINETQLRIERLIAAAPETVFDHWIKPELFASWFGPEGCEIPEYEIDPVVGGAWTVTVLTAECNQHKVSGVWRAIERPSRVVFAWGWHDDKGNRGHETEVSVTFEPAPGGTKLVLLQREFENADMVSQHRQGWTSSLNGLNKIITGNA